MYCAEGSLPAPKTQVQPGAPTLSTAQTHVQIPSSVSSLWKQCQVPTARFADTALAVDWLAMNVSADVWLKGRRAPWKPSPLPRGPHRKAEQESCMPAALSQGYFLPHLSSQTTTLLTNHVDLVQGKEEKIQSTFWFPRGHWRNKFILSRYLKPRRPGLLQTG